MTAIAAVLALATPALAQEVTPAPIVTAPATPEPTTAAPESAPATPMTTSDPLSADVPTEASSVAAPAAKPPRAVRTTHATTSARSVKRVRPATSQARVAAAPAAVPAPTPVAVPAPIAPVIAAPIAAIPAPVAAPAPVAPPAATMAADDVLPIAGAAGLGLLALLGAGAALRRRKRRAEEAEDAEFAAFDEPRFEPSPVPVAYAEPVREPQMTPAPFVPAAVATTSEPIDDAPTTTIPEGFDVSRFGPHVQAAYQGPTEDNPSLSLKNRLRRGSAMDQMARSDDAVAEPASQSEPAPPAADTGAVVSKLRAPPRSNGDFMLDGSATRPGQRPVTQH